MVAKLGVRSSTAKFRSRSRSGTGDLRFKTNFFLPSSMPFSQPHVVPSPRLWISDLHDMGALNPPGGSEWIASFASPRGGHTRSVQRSKRKSTWCFPPPAGKRALIVQDINTDAGKRLTVLAMAVSRGSIIGCNVPIASPQVRPKERGISTSRVGSTASGAGDVAGSCGAEAACADRSRPLAN